MKGFSLSALVNALLASITVFFILCYPFSLALNRVMTIVFSAISAVALGAFVYVFSYNKEKRKNELKFGKYAFNQRMAILYACTDDEISAILSELIDKMHICADVSGRHMRLKDGRRVFFLLLPLSLSANELASVLREISYREEKITIVSSDFSKEARIFADIVGVKLVDGFDFGKLLEKNDLLPKTDEKRKKAAFFERLSPFFYKTNGKRFLLYAAILGQFSRFSFYPVYYVISSAIFAISRSENRFQRPP